MTAIVIPFVRAPNVADARAELVKWSRAVIRSMHRQCDEDVLTACYYLRQFGGRDDLALAARARVKLRLRDEIPQPANGSSSRLWVPAATTAGQRRRPPCDAMEPGRADYPGCPYSPRLLPYDAGGEPSDETSARIALRHLPRWPAVLAGAVAFIGFWWGVVALVMGAGG